MQVFIIITAQTGIFCSTIDTPCVSDRNKRKKPQYKMQGDVIMSQTVNVNFKLDPEVKKRMEKACSDMGLSMSAAFTICTTKI